MICDEVRDLLPEHLLGTLGTGDDIEVRHHLRGCASCRAEMLGLGEGLTRFAHAAHDREPPAELRGRVLTVLDQDWRDVPATSGRSRWPAVIGAAAVLAILIASIAVAVSAGRRADLAQADASSYHRLLQTLGGKEFRIGQVRSEVAREVEGSVVLYDSHEGQSWGVVLVRAPGWSGTATATLGSDDGRTIEVGELEFADDGDAATWLVTGGSLEPYERLTINLPDGSVLASARIEAA